LRAEIGRAGIEGGGARSAGSSGKLMASDEMYMRLCTLTPSSKFPIEAAVEEGRAVFDNLTKFIVWILPINAGLALILLAAIIAGVALPLLPTRLLWINMVTAVLLGLTLVFETKKGDLMQRRSRSTKTSADLSGTMNP
jgi:cation-transporting P-type ATPase F